jgi:hypothetical protein
MLMSRRGQAATVTSTPGMTEGRLVIRPHPWRQWPMALMMVAATVLGVSVWAGSYPGAARQHGLL